MKCEIEEFIGYLHNTRGTSKNTEVSYERDLKKLERFLTEEKIESVEQVNATLLNSYLFPEVLLLSERFFIFYVRQEAGKKIRLSI